MRLLDRRDMFFQYPLPGIVSCEQHDNPKPESNQLFGGIDQNRSGRFLRLIVCPEKIPVAAICAPPHRR